MRDLSDLLQNCIKYFKRDETQMKAHFERQMSELRGQLKRYQQSTDDSGAADLVTRQQDALRNMK